MRLAFMGTPDFSVPFLQKLHQAGHEIVAVYTQPPRKGGRRGLKEIPSPVSQAATELGLPVYSPKSLRNEEEQAKFAALNLDAAIVVAYGLILPEPILSAPNLGCYNGHASLLPRWRGAAPIHRAIEAGDSETGIVIMQMDKGLDTGPILCAVADGQQQPLISKMAITADTTTGEAFECLSHAGAELMAKAVATLTSGNYAFKSQPTAGVSYANKIDKSETRVDWKISVEKVQQHICSLSPFPGAWTEMCFNSAFERVKILNSHIPTEAEWQHALDHGVLLLKSDVQSTSQVLYNSANLAHKKEPAFLAVCCGDSEANTNLIDAESQPQNIVLLTKLQKAGSKALVAEDFLRGREIKALR